MGLAPQRLLPSRHALTMADPAQRHGGPDAGWYVPDGHGWQRISDGEVSGHGDAAHFMSDPNKANIEGRMARLAELLAALGVTPKSASRPTH